MRQIAAALVRVGLALFAASIDGPVSADQVAQAPGSVMAAGDVRAIDKDSGQLTIDHGPLLNLSVPPAVRAFRVLDRSLLDRMKVGDSILFLAENIAGELTVTRIETDLGDPHGDH